MKDLILFYFMIIISCGLVGVVIGYFVTVIMGLKIKMKKSKIIVANV